MNKNETNKKLILRRCILVTVIILLFPILQVFLVWGIGSLVSPFVVKDSISLYADGSFKKLYCGQEAAEFFPDLKEESDNQITQYYYQNNSFGNTLLLGRCASVHLLDIKYEDKQYLEKKNSLVFSNAVIHCSNNVYVISVSDVKKSVCILGGGIRKYARVNCIEFNDEKKVIRYMVISDYLLNDSGDIQASFEDLYIRLSRNVVLRSINDT